MKTFILSILIPACCTICLAACTPPPYEPSPTEWHHSAAKHWCLPQSDGDNNAVIGVVYGYENHTDADKDYICDICGHEAYLVEEAGKLYVVLPTSKVQLPVVDSFLPYWEGIDLGLLKAAEGHILDQLAPYNEQPHFVLEVRDGVLGLYAEAIVDIDPPSSPDGEQSGCGIDHEHLFFFEPITT